MEEWLKLAIEIQSLAQAGLAYTDNVYDIERYERLREISAKMLSIKTGISVDKVKGLFCNETGYQTPKLDTRAAIFKDNKILLVHENNATWSLPGGWCDVLESVGSNTIKEVKEETGLDVENVKIISVQDRNKHNKPIYAYGVCKIFVLCNVIGGEFIKNIETLDLNSKYQYTLNFLIWQFKDEDKITEESFKNWNWEYFILNEVYKIMTEDNDSIIISEQQKKIIENICNDRVLNADFRNSIKYEKDKTWTTNWLCIYLWFYRYKFNFVY